MDKSKTRSKSRTRSRSSSSSSKRKTQRRRSSPSSNSLIFVSGNRDKVIEAGIALGFHLDNVDIDLKEIQSVQVEDVVKEKVIEAYEILKKPVIVEDTGLYIKDMNGFPGALIKFYHKRLGNEEICERDGGSDCYAEAIIAYYDGHKMKLFRGRAEGKIGKEVQYGESNFGWDPIFIPKNYSRSFAQMSKEEKNAISHRSKAFKKLKSYLNK